MYITLADNLICIYVYKNQNYDIYKKYNFKMINRNIIFAYLALESK